MFETIWAYVYFWNPRRGASGYVAITNRLSTLATPAMLILLGLYLHAYGDPSCETSNVVGPELKADAGHAQPFLLGMIGLSSFMGILSVIKFLAGFLTQGVKGLLEKDRSFDIHQTSQISQFEAATKAMGFGGIIAAAILAALNYSDMAQIQEADPLVHGCSDLLQSTSINQNALIAFVTVACLSNFVNHFVTFANSEGYYSIRELRRDELRRDELREREALLNNGNNGDNDREPHPSSCCIL